MSNLSIYKAAYETTMSFIESEAKKKIPAPVGSASWEKFKNNMNFLEEKMVDKIVNWLIEIWPPFLEHRFPYLDDCERVYLDSAAYNLLIRSYRTGMVAKNLIDDIISNLAEYNFFYTEDSLYEIFIRHWNWSLDHVKEPWIN